ncbi:hypothetical protein P8C59_002902 [Phyllachora maydis]|uniref:Bromo domain-containing protein n=1 Tax=Phyllachora maydis TaxID=1825666 RepID=A0AAD9MBW5_9PEZI|nr:hypothetical protein P8C59_002902 [Phyllachora maydis]
MYVYLPTYVLRNKIIYMPGLPPSARLEQISTYQDRCGGIQWTEERIRSTVDGTWLSLALANVRLCPGTCAAGAMNPRPAHIYVLYFQGNASSTPPRLPDLNSDDRAAKRRKVPDPSKFDLSMGETNESTTAYGLKLLDTIRKVADKSGRTIAGRFEYLPPRSKNKQYFERIRMPIALKTIERKLLNQDFATLSDLEGFFKRMVTNNKEFYPKNSGLFEDTERMRKALSNYMRVQNPAYTKPGANYSCQAAPIPENYEPHPDDFGPVESGSDEGGYKNASGTDAAGGEDAESEEDAAPGDEDAETATNLGKEQSADADGDDDAEGEEDDEPGTGRDGQDDDEVKERRRIVIKRGSTGDTARNSLSRTTAAKSVKAGRGKPDHEYEGVPYKSLNFQQAQEKIVEELIRLSDEHGDPYFLDFINLPPRSMKEYFSVIANPLSLKGLQKQVKGIHGRQAATGVSVFKCWAAFEERASLLWNNAHYYNEEGSEVYEAATELKEAFEEELEKAKAVVQEPPQPKIKLKVPPETQQVPMGKKITIHVGGSRGSTAISPVLGASQSGEGSPVDGTTMAASRDPPGARASSVASAAMGPVAPFPPQANGASPSPSVAGVKQETLNRPSPAVLPRPVGVLDSVAKTLTPAYTASALLPPPPPQPQPQPQPPQPVLAPVHNGYHPVIHAPPPPPMYDSKFRAPGRGIADALITNITLRTHPSIRLDKRFKIQVPAHPKLAHQTITILVPGEHRCLQIIPKIAPLEQQKRQFRQFVIVNGVTLHRAPPLPIPEDPLPLDAIVYDGTLQHGVNMIQIHMIAALPRGQQLPNGAECELEKVTILAHLLRS